MGNWERETAILRFVAGELSAQESFEFECSLASDAALAEEVERALEIDGVLRACQDPATPTRNWRPLALAAAAVVLFLGVGALISTLWSKANRPRTTNIEIEIAQGPRAVWIVVDEPQQALIVSYDSAGERMFSGWQMITPPRQRLDLPPDTNGYVVSSKEPLEGIAVERAFPSRVTPGQLESGVVGRARESLHSFVVAYELEDTTRVQAVEERQAASAPDTQVEDRVAISPPRVTRTVPKPPEGIARIEEYEWLGLEVPIPKQWWKANGAMRGLAILDHLISPPAVEAWHFAFVLDERPFAGWPELDPLVVVRAADRGSSPWSLASEPKPLRTRWKGPRPTTAIQLRAGALDRSRGGLVVRFPVDERTDLLLVGTGPGEKSWPAWELAFRDYAARVKAVKVPKSIQQLEGWRKRRYRTLAAQFQALEGWRIEISPDLFLVTDCNGRFKRDFEELEESREALKLRFPPALSEAEQGAAFAKQIEVLAERPPAELAAVYGNINSELGDFLRGENFVNPMASSASVIRLFASREKYELAGGPRGSNVDFRLGRGDIFACQEGVDSYLLWSRILGASARQHLFFQLGRGDFDNAGWLVEGVASQAAANYSKLRNNQAGAIVEFGRGQRQVFDDLRIAGRIVPLHDFITWRSAEFAGENDLKVTAVEASAQAWALVHFLDSGRAAGPGRWREAWNDLVPRYFVAVRDGASIADANQAIFGALDLTELESAWLASFD